MITRKKSIDMYVSILLGTGIFLLYWVTLAPTVLWGDDAHFQTIAYTGIMHTDGGDHWLWLLFAQLFASFSQQNTAYYVNLLSAIAALGTTLLMYATARTMKLTISSAIVTTLSLAVSHTFWTHAVRAEVYTLFTFLMALQLFLWFYWQADRPIPIFIAVGLLGIMLLSHQMTILLIPALITCLWQRRGWINQKQWLQLILVFVVGMIPFLVVVYQQIAAPMQNNFIASLSLYFTHAGESDFSNALFDFSFHTLTRDVVLWITFLGLQFVGLSMLLGLGGIIANRRNSEWLPIFTLFITTTLFAFSYHVNDQFVFYLPSYLPFALYIGAGWQQYLIPRIKNRSKYLSFILIAIIVATPVLTYYVTAQALTMVQINPMGIRELPGREANIFFLWPSKRGYEGASDYGHVLLNSLPQNSILIADHTPLETLRYLQTVENIRTDIQLVKIEADDNLVPIIQTLPVNSKIYLADDNPDYYNLQNLSNALLTKKGIAYQLEVEQR